MYKLSIVLFLCCCWMTAQAQHAQQGIFLLPSITAEKLTDGPAYRPYQIAPRFDVWTLHKGRKSLFLASIEPQFLIAFQTGKNSQTAYEMGANLAFSYVYALTDTWGVRGAIGSGPHFITLDTYKQRKGYIFSDNFEASSYFRFAEGRQLWTGLRFRHISNAGIMLPNQGIDNFFWVLGYSVDL